MVGLFKDTVNTSRLKSTRKKYSCAFSVRHERPTVASRMRPRLSLPTIPENSNNVYEEVWKYITNAGDDKAALGQIWRIIFARHRPQNVQVGNVTVRNRSASSADIDEVDVDRLVDEFVKARGDKFQELVTTHLPIGALDKNVLADLQLNFPDPNVTSRRGG